MTVYSWLEKHKNNLIWIEDNSIGTLKLGVPNCTLNFVDNYVYILLENTVYQLNRPFLDDVVSNIIGFEFKIVYSELLKHSVLKHIRNLS